MITESTAVPALASSFVPLLSFDLRWSFNYLLTNLIVEITLDWKHQDAQHKSKEDSGFGSTAVKGLYMNVYTQI